MVVKCSKNQNSDPKCLLVLRLYKLLTILAWVLHAFQKENSAGAQRFKCACPKP